MSLFSFVTIFIVFYRIVSVCNPVCYMNMVSVILLYTSLFDIITLLNFFCYFIYFFYLSCLVLNLLICFCNIYSLFIIVLSFSIKSLLNLITFFVNLCILEFIVFISICCWILYGWVIFFFIFSTSFIFLFTLPSDKISLGKLMYIFGKRECRWNSVCNSRVEWMCCGVDVYWEGIGRV